MGNSIKGDMVKFKGREFWKKLINPGTTYDVYGVERTDDQPWPTDEELINLCDSGNFGGEVSRRKDRCLVTVYTD